jgi:hypothetical protein
MERSEFETLMQCCAELAARHPDGLVFIGGIAVYLHACNHEATAALAEFTHDADAYVSLADMGDLRDEETLTANRRLSKHQLVLRGFEFDLYTERQSSLIVPYDAVRAHGRIVDTLRIACLEHLLVLKLEAYRDRRHSSKGEKDAKDLMRIGAVAQASGKRFDGTLAAPYLSDDHLKLLEQIERGPAAVALAQGNAMVAKKLRQGFSRLRSAVSGEGRSWKP